MIKEKHLFYLLEGCEKLRDFNINVIPNKSLEEYYNTWIEQIKTRKITDLRLVRYIENQIIYHRPKDREYAVFLENFVKGE